MYDQTSESRRKPWFQKPMWIATGAITLVTILLMVLTFTVFIPESIESDGETQQSGLNTRASTAYGAMDKCVQDTARAAQVANAQTDALSRVLKEAVSGRYGEGDELDKNKIFSLLQEAYPDTSGLDRTFERAMAVMLGCQDDFLRAQNNMIGDANAFVTWMHGSWTTRTFGAPEKFPNERLKIVVARQTIASGATALEMMQQPIVEVDTANSIERGVREGSTSANNNPFDRPTATPTG